MQSALMFMCQKLEFPLHHFASLLFMFQRIVNGRPPKSWTSVATLQTLFCVVFGPMLYMVILLFENDLQFPKS